MKLETKKILEDKGRIEIFTDERFEVVKSVMKHGITKDAWLKNYLSLDPINKAQWCADHIIILVDGGHI